MAEIALGAGRGDGRLRTLLSYPRYSPAHYDQILLDLDAIGVASILSAGRVEVGDLRAVGKGCVGLVVAGLLDGRRVALKIRRTDSNRASLSGEARMLAAANSVGVGPKLIASTDNVLVMEYIDGRPMHLWARERHTAGEVRAIVGGVLDQCFRLDAAGIDHGELSNSKKHLLVAGKPYIIDFETAGLDRRCRNLVSVVSYLFFRQAVSPHLARYLSWEREEVKSAVRVYKDEPSRHAYDRIRDSLGIG